MGQASLDDVLGRARASASPTAPRELIQRTLDSYNSGIHVSSVNLTDVQVPDAVLTAQRDANKAIEDRERFSKDAQTYANDLLPNAEGQAQRFRQNAEAYKAQVVTLAEGDVARFNSVYAVYAQAPEVDTPAHVYRKPSNRSCTIRRRSSSIRRPAAMAT